MSLPKKLPDGFVYVSEVCSSIQVDLMYSTDDNFTGSIVPGYKKNVAIMTEKAALQLAKVQDHLSTIGFGLNHIGRRMQYLLLRNGLKSQKILK